MAEPGKLENIFACNIGCNFSDKFVDGFIERFENYPPEYISNINLYVNTKRLSESIRESFLKSSPGFLPKIFSITDLRHLALEYPLPELSNPLEEQLTLNELIKRYLEKSPNTAPMSASYELAYDLIKLRNEMYSENVSIEKVKNLSKENISSHWQQSLKFLNIIFDYWSKENDSTAIEAINLKVISILEKKWTYNPPKYPIIIAGSTGSRGITKTFIELVSKQKLGMIVLPGFDFSQTKKVWSCFKVSEDFEDHPQYRYFKLVTDLSIHPKSVESWAREKVTSSPRNQLISLALRPAPVTDQWLEEGPKLRKLASATSGLTLIEAPSVRDEANAIALCIRKAVEDNKSIALISPDQDLSRQVTTALGRWNLIPDNITGQSLSLTPTGIFLRQISNLIGQEITAENLIPLLKNPLTNTGNSNRGEHLNLIRNVELELRESKDNHQPILQFLTNKLRKSKNVRTSLWLSWIDNTLEGIDKLKTAQLNEFLAFLIQKSEQLSNGPDGKTGILWEKNSGENAKNVLNNLILAGKNIQTIKCLEFNAIVNSVLRKESVRETIIAHPLIKLWGTLDARISNTEITILGSMNEGVWPQLTSVDPWLSRSMRKQAGLLSPERRVGLLAHDFQQGVANKEVIITRSKRIDDIPAIPSRWLNRITNLLKGLGEDGNDQLKNIKIKGDFWINLARAIEEPLKYKNPTERPSPIPPLSARPKKLSVTQIEKLIRDPYSIYARHILGLKKLQPLRRQATPLLKGNIIHKIMKNFSELTKNDYSLINSYELKKLADKIFFQEVPWPAIRFIWKARFEEITPLFLEAEKLRRLKANPLFAEHPGSTYLKTVGTTFTAIADRIDKTKTNELLIYDYKSGKPPTLSQLENFHKQLLIEALIAEDGGFNNIPSMPVILICYISLNNSYPNTEKIITPKEIEQIRNELSALISYYQNEQTGYTARLRMEKTNSASDYDHLSRYGEWDETNPPIKIILK